MKLLDVTDVKIQSLDYPRMVQHPWTPYEIPDNTIGVTTIIKHIAVKIGKFTKEEEQDDDRVVPLRALVGMGWEAMCAQLYPDLIWQPGAFVLDGIVGHPDGFGEVLVPHAEPCNDEFKYTAKSIRVKGGKDDQYKSILDEWMWNVQQMAYLKLHPLEPVHGRFHVCWAMGNYTKFTLDERYMRYLVLYTRDEIERNWNMLVDHRDEVKRSII